jgi:hypothetical protein
MFPTWANYDLPKPGTPDFGVPGMTPEHCSLVQMHRWPVPGRDRGDGIKYKRFTADAPRRGYAFVDFTCPGAKRLPPAAREPRRQRCAALALRRLVAGTLRPSPPPAAGGLRERFLATPWHCAGGGIEVNHGRQLLPVWPRCRPPNAARCVAGLANAGGRGNELRQRSSFARTAMIRSVGRDCIIDSEDVNIFAVDRATLMQTHGDAPVPAGRGRSGFQ